MHDLTSNAALQRLLDANRRFDLNGRGTTNHCPMALTALAAMGADAGRLEQFFTYWEQRHALVAEAQAPLARGAWESAVGNTALFCATRDCLADWVAQDGAGTVLREIVGKLTLAPASGAFHALIRLAYGLDAGNVNEIGAGLAALACGRLAIDSAPQGRAPAASVEAGLAQLARWLPDTKVAGGWIAPRLDAVAQLPAFRAVLPAMPENEDLLPALRRTALSLYWQTDDFISLHMVTGVHAARVVLPHLSEDMARSCLPQLWSAFCAAYVLIGAPPLQEPNVPDEDEDWAKLFALAVASNDDHDIKLVHTCFEENRVSPSPLYFAAALGRLHPTTTPGRIHTVGLPATISPAQAITSDRVTKACHFFTI